MSIPSARGTGDSGFTFPSIPCEMVRRSVLQLLTLPPVARARCISRPILSLHPGFTLSPALRVKSDLVVTSSSSPDDLVQSFLQFGAGLSKGTLQKIADKLEVCRI
jgi:hypothetical protein